MNTFAACLFFLVLLLALQRIWTVQETWPLVFWMIPCGLLFEIWLPSDRTVISLAVFSLCAAAFYQDLASLHFGRRWLLSLPVMLSLARPAFWSEADLAGMILILALGILGWRAEKIGSADVLFLAAAVPVLQLQRMILCLLLACCSALIYSRMSRRRMIPFLSFLSWSFAVCWCEGWRLSACLLDWIRTASMR